MGNAVIPPQNFSDAPQVCTPTDHNGWLIHIRADDMGPRPGGAHQGAPSPVYVDTDVPGLGRMRIMYELYKYQHRRNSFWAYRAVWADKIDQSGNVA